MQKITKKEFIEYALANGLMLCGAAGLTLDQAKEVCDKNPDFTAERVPVTAKGQHLMRGSSNLYLNGDDTVYKYGNWYLVHSFSPAGSGRNFDSYNTIFYK